MGTDTSMTRASAHLSSAHAIATRLLDLHASALRTLSPDAYGRAVAWYPCERGRLKVIARETGVFAETAIAAAATLSPATSWRELVLDLPAFLRAARTGDPCPPFATYGAQRRLAARIVQGALGPAACSGPKVLPFALALDGDAAQVVVDRHVARYALGDAPGDASRVSVGAAERRAIQAAHVLAGSALGIPPRNLQSLLWVARVGEGGRSRSAEVPT